MHCKASNAPKMGDMIADYYSEPAASIALDRTTPDVSSTGYRDCHTTKPPLRAAASKPRPLSCCAARALVVSPGQLQYATIDRSFDLSAAHSVT